MVHSGVRWRMRFGVDIWFSPGRLAIRVGRSGVVGRGDAALVAGRQSTLMLVLRPVHSRKIPTLFRIEVCP
jgi:hypothetical protein